MAEERFVPLTERDIAEGRMRSFRITLKPTGYDEAPASYDIFAVSLSRALRVLATRLENPDYKGPVWLLPPPGTVAPD